MDQKELIRTVVQAGVLKKGVKVKAGIIALILLIVGLIVLGGFPAGSASAATCEDTGPGTADATAESDTGGGGDATGTLHEQYAKTIDSVAKKHKLPGRATLIALMTVMQESSMQNLDHGMDDSVGLFQQRPSMGWGTNSQIRTPSYATESFFFGRGTNPGLVDFKNWQKLPLGDAAQKVQKSAHPTLYAGHETAMRKLAKEAGIDVDRGGSTTGDKKGTAAGGAGTNDPVTSENKCAVATTPGATAGGSGTFSDGKQTWNLSNPRTVNEAIAWAKSHSGAGSTSNWYQRCLAYTAIVYGWSFSGVNYAIDHFTVVPKSMQHRGDRNPPPGALMYWDTGHRAGHIAVYLGDGKVASNDILRPGYIDVVDAGLFETKWGAKYVGWTPPYFPRAG